MESRYIPRENYVDKMKSFISFKNISNSNENKYLTLRKIKKNAENNLHAKITLNLLDEYHYRINLNSLSTNNDGIRNFSIDLNKPEITMNNLKALLNSKNDDEVKYGIYATRKFFQDLLRNIYKEDCGINHNQNYINYNINQANYANGFENNYNKESKIPLYKINNNNTNRLKYNCPNILELFLTNNIFYFLFEISKRYQNKDDIRGKINLYECLWIFINLSALYSKEEENSKSKFLSCFTQENNLSFLISIIDSSKYPLEIIFNDLVLLSNICKISEVIKEYVIKSSLTMNLCNYLQTEKSLNSDVIIKVLKLLYELYSDDIIELTVEAYIILFNIFSFALISFDNDSIMKYCLKILNNLSKKDIPDVIRLFSDEKLLNTLIAIVFSRPIKENELIVNEILDIFYNIISKNDEIINKNIIEKPILIIFYNNLLIKFRDEKVKLNYLIEQNIITSINNIIMLNSEFNTCYILEKGKEILNFLISESQNVFSNTKLSGIQSLVIFLSKINIDVNIEILKEMANSIIQALVNDYVDCYYVCAQGLAVLIRKCIKQNLDNELRSFLLIKGTNELVEKIKVKIMNDKKNTKLKEEDEIEYYNIIDVINQFLN